jgi:hypothetical protein
MSKSSCAIKLALNNIETNQVTHMKTCTHKCWNPVHIELDFDNK